MKFIVVPPREGVVWVRRAFQVFFRQPLGFASLFVVCAVVFFVLLRVPLVGESILLVITPAGSLLFMIAARLGTAGKRPVPGAFVELAGADRARLLAMLKLGVAYLLVALVSIGITAAVGGDALGAFMDATNNPQASPEAIATQLADPRVQGGLVLFFGLGSLLSISFWHAPGLVYWGAQGWAKAIFFSTVAIWRNKGAFTVYGLVWLGLGFVFSMLLGVVIGIAGPVSAAYVAAPLILFFVTVLYVSLWFTFNGCFAEELAPPPLASA